MIEKISKFKSVYVVSISLFMVIIFCSVDVITKEYLDFSVFYFLPIALAAWFAGRKYGFILALASSTAWVYSEWSIGTRYRETHGLILNSILIIVTDLLLVILLDRLKKEIKNSVQRELLKKKNEAIIKTSQGICGIIAQHVACHNSEIINWVNKRKNSGHQVSEKIENSSLAIGESVKTLTEIFYSDNGFNNTSDPEDYLAELEKKFVDIKSKN